MFIHAYQMVLVMDGISRYEIGDRYTEMFWCCKSEPSLLLNESMNSTSWQGHPTLDCTVVIVLGNGNFFHSREFHTAVSEPELNDRLYHVVRRISLHICLYSMGVLLHDHVQSGVRIICTP